MTGRPASFDAALMAALPSLRRLCLKLTRHREAAEDLAGDAICKALANWHRFDPNTNISAWLTTIARNTFFSAVRREGRVIEDVDGSYAAAIAIGGNQEHKLACDDAFARIGRMPVRQRHAVLSVAMGASYDEAAEETGIPIGTVKSEIHRARMALKEIVA